MTDDSEIVAEVISDLAEDYWPAQRPITFIVVLMPDGTVSTVVEQ